MFLTPSVHLLWLDLRQYIRGILARQKLRPTVGLTGSMTRFQLLKEMLHLDVLAVGEPTALTQNLKPPLSFIR